MMVDYRYSSLDEVSVPLRGIGSEKLSYWKRQRTLNLRPVSVPLRGIGSEKQGYSIKPLKMLLYSPGFRPLAGNRF